MNQLRLLPVLFCLLLLTGCGSAGSCKSEGYDSADAAYQAYLDTVLECARTGDSTAMTSLFSAAEQKAAPKASKSFMRREFGLNKETYQEYLQNAKPDAFIVMCADEIGAMHSALAASGVSGDALTMEAGEPNQQDGTVARDFSDMLELNITGITTYSAFTLRCGSGDSETVAGKPMAVIELDGKWYPSYLAECAL